MSDSRENRLNERVAAEVARVTPSAKLDGVSRARLRNRILAAADAVLDPAPAWWEMAGRWVRPVVPTAIAAGIMLVLIGAPPQGAPDGVALAEDVGEEWMLLADDPVPDGPADLDGLLMAALSTD